MKRITLFAVAAMLVLPAFILAKKIKVEPAPEAAEIHWLSVDELQAKMNKTPRKVFIDVYTGWCGWCKKMEATTFKNPDLVKYMNNNFYCVRLDAERKDTIRFQGKVYYFDPKFKANTFAVELMNGNMSYPTSIIMLENYQNPQPIPGYHDIKEMEPILSYFGDNAFKHQKWEDFQKSYKPTWDHGAAPDMTPPPGH